MRRDRTRRAVVTGLPFLLAYLVDLVVFAMLRDRLPVRLASHFEGSGQANDTAGHAEYLVVVSVLVAGLGALWIVISRGARSLIVMGWALAALTGYLFAAVLYANLGSPAEFPPRQFAAAAAAALLAAAAGWWLTRFVSPVLPPPAEGNVERLDLGSGETAGWGRYAGSWLMGLVATAVLGTAGAVWVVAGWQAAMPPLALGLVTVLLARPYVAVDRRGLTISPGVVRWPRLSVSIDQVERATSRDVSALKEFGGWGYRIRSGRSGLILRSGEAIVVRRRDGRDFAVTVDGSADAAALLNTLVERRVNG